MQKVVTIRVSQKDLEAVIEKFISFGWRVLNVTKGSEWGRVGFSYKWTIILDLGDNYKNADKKIDRIVSEFSLTSFAKNTLLFIGLIVGVLAFFAILVVALQQYV